MEDMINGLIEFFDFILRVPPEYRVRVLILYPLLIAGIIVVIFVFMFTSNC